MSRPHTLQRPAKALLIEGNQLPAFIEECTELDAKGSISLADLFQVYKLWAEENGYKFNVVRNKVSSAMESLGYSIKRVNGYPCVNGLKLRKATKGRD